MNLGIVFSGIALITVYCIGSIPTGYLVARTKGIENIRKHGSGNIGATNVARLLGVRYFFLVFLLDAFKAFICLWLLRRWGFDATVVHLAAAALLLGNGCSLFLNFTGGKGIATSVGILAALSPQLLGAVLVPWLVVLAATKTVGIASVVALACAPVLAWFLAPELLLLTLFMSGWGIWRHQSNLVRFFYKD